MRLRDHRKISNPTPFTNQESSHGLTQCDKFPSLSGSATDFQIPGEEGGSEDRGSRNDNPADKDA